MDYGCITCNIVTNTYCMRQRDRLVAVSMQTLNRLTDLQKSAFHNRTLVHRDVKPVSNNVHTLLLNFSKFDNSKTAANTGEWMKTSAEHKGVNANIVYSTNLDGAALSAGRVFDELTNENRTNEIDNNHCGFHCVNLSSKEGIGVKKSKHNLNPALGRSLKKVNSVLSKLNIKTLFMKECCNIQTENARSPIITIQTA